MSDAVELWPERPRQADLIRHVFTRRGIRVRFAWWPVALAETDEDGWFHRLEEKVWLRPVLEVRTAFAGWVAYRSFQKHLPEFTDD